MESPSADPALSHGQTDCGLNSLPLELVLDLLEYLSFHSLNSLSQTSKRYCKTITPYLYSSAASDDSKWHPGTEFVKGHVLLWAGRNGKLQAIKNFVKHAPPKYPLKDQLFYALMEASKAGHEDVVGYLLDFPVNPNPPHKLPRETKDNPETPLFFASAYQHANIVRMLLDAGAKVITPRYIKQCVDWLTGIEPNRLDTSVAQLLIKKGFNVGLVDPRSGSTLLHEMASLGHAPMLELLIAFHAEVNGRDGSGQTPLYIAVARGREQAARVLLRAGASPNAADEDSESPLHAAAQCCHAGLVSELLANGANINAKTSKGQTPLHFAASGAASIIKTLLDAGAPFSVMDNAERTPLLKAMIGGGPENIQLLLDAGAIDCPSEYTPTLLRWVAAKNFPMLLQRLLDNNVDPNGVLDVRRNTPLMLAVKYGCEENVRILLPRTKNPDAQNNCGDTAMIVAVRKENKIIVDLLLKHSVCPTSPNHGYGRTPMMYAVRLRGTDITSLLLEHYTDLDQRDYKQKTALHHAVKGGLLENVKMLLKSGAEVDPRDKEGYTPFLLAARFDKTDIAEFLLGIDNVNINAIDTGNKTALVWAVENQNDRLVSVLLQKGVDVQGLQHCMSQAPLFVAATTGNKIILQMLLDAGADPEPFTIDDNNPLWSAVSQGHADVAQTLINVVSRNPGFESYWHIRLLYAAAIKGRTEVIKVLLDAGIHVDLNLSKADGVSALMVAASHNHADTVETLMARSADVNCVDPWSRLTPLIVAAQNGYISVVAALLRHHDIAINLPDHMGRTPLSWAVEKGHAAVVQLLVNAGADTIRGDRAHRTPLFYALQHNSTSCGQTSSKAGDHRGERERERYKAWNRGGRRVDVQWVDAPNWRKVQLEWREAAEAADRIRRGPGKADVIIKLLYSRRI